MSTPIDPSANLTASKMVRASGALWQSLKMVAESLEKRLRMATASTSKVAKSTTQNTSFTVLGICKSLWSGLSEVVPKIEIYN